jgi:dipeptidyl aminopeptidase/acylaminoacyl peptidase
MEASDLVNLREVSDPQISPDGSLVAYVLTTPVPARQRRNANIWMVATDGRSEARPFVLSGGMDTSPRWSPDGKQLAFLSDRANPLPGDPGFHFSIVGADDRKDLIRKDKKELPLTPESSSQTQVWIISLAGGEAVPLTDMPGGIKAFKWSADGKQLGFIRTDQDTKEEMERKEHKEDHIEVDRNYKFDRLWGYDLSSRQARLLTKRDANIDDFEWSPDGRRVLARISPTPRIDDYWRVSTIEVLDAKTGEVEKTLLEKAAPAPMHWSPDGLRVAVSKASSKNITNVPTLIDVDSGKQTIVAEAYRATVGDMEWDLDGKALTASATEGTDLIFLRIDGHTGSATKVTGVRGPSGWFGKVSVSRDGTKEVYLQETREHPGEVAFRSGDHETLLTHTNPQTSNWKIGTEEKLNWKSSKDGLTIYGLVILPPDYQTGRRYKTIVFAHGGPEGAWESGFHSTWYDWGALLASHGYVVFLPNPRGSTGLGTDFTEANYANWGDSDFPDVMDGVDALVAKGIADPDRLGVGGWSYGGYMTAWAVTHTDRFKVAVAGAAVTDLFADATTTDIAPSYFDGYFGDLASHRKLYDDHSPVRFLDRCHTPTLVVHGEADVRVPISQGEEFYHGLRFMGRETEMLRYPREPHIFTETEHQRNSLERMLWWYDIHLGN